MKELLLIRIWIFILMRITFEKNSINYCIFCFVLQSFLLTLSFVSILIVIPKQETIRNPKPTDLKLTLPVSIRKKISFSVFETNLISCSKFNRVQP